MRIYRVDVEPEPAIAIDRREVIWAGFLHPNDARRLDLFPWVRDYLDVEHTHRSEKPNTPKVFYDDSATPAPAGPRSGR
jgi:hypothetical protein